MRFCVNNTTKYCFLVLVVETLLKRSFKANKHGFKLDANTRPQRGKRQKNHFQTFGGNDWYDGVSILFMRISPGWNNGC